MDSSIRILAHLKVVDLLEQNKLQELPGAQIYIGWVQEAAADCLKILAEGLARNINLPKIYLKSPVHLKVDFKGGRSDAITLPTSQEFERVKQEVFREPFKLVFSEDVRGYMSQKGETIVADKEGLLYQEVIKVSYTEGYITDPKTHLEVYPHNSENGKIFSNFLEPRELNALKNELTQAALTQIAVKKIEEVEINGGSIEAKAIAAINATTDEPAKLISIEIENTIRYKIKLIVEGVQTIKLTPTAIQAVNVQDHYPVQLIIKQVVEGAPINELRDKIYQEIKENAQLAAPKIDYPRVSIYAKTREGLNLLGATYAHDYLQGENPQLKQLIKLLNIGIERIVRAHAEEEQQKLEQEELKEYLKMLTITDLSK